jgi:hypothetical protein
VVQLHISACPFFKSPLPSCTPMCVWVYSRGRPFPLSRLAYVTLTADGAPVDALAVFPRHKGRKNFPKSLSFLFYYLVLLIMNR